MSPAIQIAPSILSADFLNLQRDISLLTQSAEPPEWLHIDVMDGHFVPNLTIGPPFVRALKRITAVPLDVHLMIANPAEQLDWYLDAGADLLTVHLEAAAPSVKVAEKGSSATVKVLDELDTEALSAMFARIRAAGALAGLSLNPDTPVGLLLPFYRQIDLALLMSVHPGFGGQSFIPQSLARLTQIKADAEALGADILLEVDGGIDVHTAPLAVAAGANVLVAGNAIFAQANPAAALQAIRQSAVL